MLKIKFNNIKNTFLLLLITFMACGKNRNTTKPYVSSYKAQKNKNIITGAQQLNNYLPLLKHKKVALVGNPTSIVFNQKNKPVHLVDTLLKHQINIKKVFAPEHGFRGKADAGEVVKNGIDIATQLPIISLYGKNKKPSSQLLVDIDLLVFDIQDVGARFYTYISTLHYVMEACAENDIPVLILDRPNPNGHYVDGPVLQKQFKSFVGLHPIPIVHGMTIGEYGQMINGELWLNNGIQCKLNVIPLKNYTHNTAYDLPVKPSPNLPNSKAINLYPSLCLFEGTLISVGRGTNTQFQVYGAPSLPVSDFSFTPQPNFGAKHPKHEGKLCYGKNLQNSPLLNKVHLKWLINTYKQSSKKEVFFTPFFNKLAGNSTLQQQIKNGLSEAEIKASWESDLNAFKQIRNKYLLYN